MNTLTQGIMVFVIFTSVVGAMIAWTIVRSRNEGVSGGPLMKRLLPYLVADGLFVVIFAIWAINEIGQGGSR